jgi:hypothetical protein
VSRGAWVLAGLALAFVAGLMVLMGRSLDMKAPIRIDRGPGPSAAVPAETLAPVHETPEPNEDEIIRALLARRAPALASRAAAQVFPAEEVARARCEFAGATPVHREEDTAYWRLDFACADTAKPGDLPNLTGVSVRLRKLEGGRWTVEE